MILISLGSIMIGVPILMLGKYHIEKSFRPLHYSRGTG